MRDDVGAMSRRISELEEELENSTPRTTLNEEEAFRGVAGMTTWENPDDQTDRWETYNDELLDMATQRPRFLAHKKRIEAAIEITSGAAKATNEATLLFIKAVHREQKRRVKKTGKAVTKGFRCFSCGEMPPPGSSHKKCSGCVDAGLQRTEWARYCSTACQKRHWKDRVFGHECPNSPERRNTPPGQAVYLTNTRLTPAHMNEVD
jgi:hypothetical protein